MSGAYLPGDMQQRIQDLIKDSSITQAELAGIIGLSESALSRYLKGQTEMLGDGYIIKIAKHFNVSTDFLLGETNIPDRKNYDIEELGISSRTITIKIPNISLSEKRRLQKSEMPLEKSLIVNEPIFITASVFSIMCFMINVKPLRIFISV